MPGILDYITLMNPMTTQSFRKIRLKIIWAMSLSRYLNSYGYCNNAALEQQMIKENPHVCALKEQLTLLFQITFKPSIELSSEEGDTAFPNAAHC